MANNVFLTIAAPLPVLAPLTACAALGGLKLANVHLSERCIERLVRSIMLAICAVALSLLWFNYNLHSPRIHYGSWLESGHYHFDIDLQIDTLSTTYLATASFIASLVGYFSVRYLNRDPGFTRFFLWFLAFVGGLNLFIMAGSLSLMVAGWELVGLSSVFLVGFYQQRSGPANNAAYVFTAYRLADIGLLAAAALLPIWISSDQLPKWGSLQAYPTGPLATTVSLFILWAAMGKSAQGPFVCWLPRAMEGPTPSSAIFYGALSVHAGAYLILRMAPAWEGLALVRGTVITLGLLTALYGGFVGLTRTDTKTLLAYASLSQLGLIFAEIGAGFYHLALWHMVGHSMVRTFQFLRTPSALGDWQSFRKDLPAANAALAHRVQSSPLALWLYRQSLDGLNLESYLRHYLYDPVKHLGRFLDFSERELSIALEGSQPRRHTEHPPEHDISPVNSSVHIKKAGEA